MARAPRKKRSFHQELVLNRWMLGFFHGGSLDALKERLGADTKAKGLGFATAGNFYPDFLLWLVDDKSGKQWLSFVDPKGIRNLDLSDPKLHLYREIKRIEDEVGDPLLTLDAFILSATEFEDLINVGDKSDREALEERHVLFLSEGREKYLTKLVRKTLQAA